MDNETNVPSTETTAPEQEKTFTQADVDALIQKRLERERKKYPGEEELSAFRAWREERPMEEKKLGELTKERDESKAALAAAQGELEQLKREKYVLSKGLSGEEAEFLAFKAAKLVDEHTTFEQAVDGLTKERQSKATFDWTAPVGGGAPKESPNAAMNNLIRGALK